ncbi:hypothetical protein GCM10022627_36600 [Haloarcula argentinensis]|uniref:Uncharacterized protein n=1 Tax=Haloarcula argentinensis TaxID=43776 RepID=A0A830FIF6_HALAR|nr:hypothetical protein GCM10009006_34000 [Haloarcula argentinensis]
MIGLSFVTKSDEGGFGIEDEVSERQSTSMRSGKAPSNRFSSGTDEHIYRLSIHRSKEYYKLETTGGVLLEQKQFIIDELLSHLHNHNYE